MRNPKWTEDEVVLALNLYFQLEWSEMYASNLKVIELSKLLNSLPGEGRIGNQKYRNPNGVGMKLQNFKALDPEYDGKGLSSYSNIDKEVFERYSLDKKSLKRRSNQLISIINNRKTIPDLELIHDEDIPLVVYEGKIISRLHRVRERDSRISKRKKEIVLKKTGRLQCEVCDFDFKRKYGDLGEGFCEVHHRTPLSEIQGDTKTTVNDLAVVCANCHRMLHKMKDMSVSGLREKLI